MDLAGKVLISRDYRGDVPLSVAEKFAKLLAEEDETPLTPVIMCDDITFMFIKHNSVYLLAVAQRNVNVMATLSFLDRLVGVLESYFQDVNEESIRDNFVITHELLDETMDFGHPQSTEAAILKEFICVQERHEYKVTQPPQALTTTVSWRKEGITYRKNQLFLDVVEKLNVLMNASNGQAVHSEIVGELKMRSQLSGMPDVKLGLNDKVLMEARARKAGLPEGSVQKSVDMEDVRFHQCVQLARFEQNRTISFIPPDGEFDLMTYRLATQVRPLFLVEANVQQHSKTRYEYTITLKANYKPRSIANNVELLVPVPSDANCPTFSTSAGTTEYLPEKDCVSWKLKQLPGQRHHVMHVQFSLPSVTTSDWTRSRPPMKLFFEIPYITVSGIQIRYLKVTERSHYDATLWLRYLTRNGDYEIRF